MISSEGLISERRAADVDRPRVLHVHSGNLYGGVETFLRTLARHQVPGVQTTMDYALCFDRRIAGELREAGATVHILGDVRVRSPRHIADARRVLARVMTEGRYNVVLCHSVWSHALFGAAARERGVRLALYLHDVPNRHGWLDRWASLTPPDLVLCNSAFTQVAGRWIFPNAKRRLIRCAVALDSGVGDSRAAVRTSLGVDDDTVVLLQASRMQPWKGHRLLVDSLSALKGSARWTCWIAGGPQRPSEEAYCRGLVAMVDRLGLASRIKFLGQRNDIPSLMRAADVYCQPNIGPEPFGLAFVEALSAGLPVVTTAMGGAVEIVKSRCGTLVRPEPQAVALALADYIASDQKRRDAAEAGPIQAAELCGVVARTRELASELSLLARPALPVDARARAALSEGRSDDAILSVVARALREKQSRFEHVVDLGCGRGDCAYYLNGMIGHYLGCDVERYDAFPRKEFIQFRQIDLNKTPYALDSASASVVLSTETIEHVENPRALVREMVRIVRPGGWVVVTTPNQLSLASKLHLIARNEFPAFQEAPGLYPAHITALVEDDLIHIARECGLLNVEIRYTDRGRIPLTPWHWPAHAGARGRWFSDNVVMLARRP